MIIRTLQNAAFWTEIAHDDARLPLISHIRNFWQNNREETIPTVTYEERMLFYKTGDRRRFETPYFRRRNALSAVAILALMHPEKEEYIAEVQRYLWAICDEYSWCLPAHTNGDPAADPFELDLFNTETGFALTEICHLLRKRLDAVVWKRVKMEVKRRIIDPYCAKLTCFDDNFANWAAVCGGNVGGSLMYWEPDRFRAQLPRILKNMQNFIDGFSDEGVCMEGPSYWCYGVSNFVWFADMLLDFTNGRTDLFDNAKMERIAGYMQRSFLKGNTTISFSDAGRYGIASDELQYYLSMRYPETICLLPREISRTWHGNVSWLHWTRALVYTPPVDAPRAMPMQSCDFPTAGQVIVHTDRYSLFAKAGHNKEEHNHNDVGSFIFSTDAGQVLCDIGSGLYTRQYFRHTMHERYAILCNSSLGHSVPIVNGGAQRFGRQYSGTICHNGNRIEIEMAGAYALPESARVSRILEHRDDGVMLMDSFEGEVNSFTDRLVTMLEPTVGEGTVRIADVCLRFDPEAMELSVYTKQHVSHHEEKQTVWLLDFRPRKDGREIKVWIGCE